MVRRRAIERSNRQYRTRPCLHATGVLAAKYGATTGIQGVLAMTRSVGPLRVGVAMVVVVVIALGLTGCVADPAPQIYNVTAGNSQATVSWSSWPGLTWPPVAYVVT